MSCNGCRVLRKGCSDTCILRPCLQWIETAEAQGHATVFVAKFFGRAGLMNFLFSVPEPQRPSLFQSLLFEACGRTVNPVNGAVGLLWTGNWHVCQAAVETVLRGGSLRPMALQGGGSFGAASAAGVEVGGPAPDIFSLGTRIMTGKRRKAVDEDDAAAIASRMLEPSDLELALSPVLRRPGSPSEGSVTTSSGSGGDVDGHHHRQQQQQQPQPSLLNLFV